MLDKVNTVLKATMQTYINIGNLEKQHIKSQMTGKTTRKYFLIRVKGKALKYRQMVISLRQSKVVKHAYVGVWQKRV